MIARLVWENLRHKPLRTMLSVLMIAVPVTLILTLIGLSNGFIEDAQRRSAGVGADILFKPPGSNPIQFSNATMPVESVDKLAAEPHVVQAMGTVVAPSGGFSAVVGIDAAAFDRMSGGFEFDSGHGLSGPDDILLDSYTADQKHVRAGGTVKELGHVWKIAGIVEPGKLGHEFVQMAPLQELQGGQGHVSQIFIKLDNKANTDQVVAALKAKYDGYSIMSMQDLESLISVDNIPLLRPFLNVIIGIGVVIGFLVVSLSMYMAVLQRTREIGILKSLGARRSLIMTLILAEAFFLGFAGTIVGILLSYASHYGIHAAMPASLPQAIVYSWWPIAGSVAMGAALLGALYPGMLAVRQDPIEALAYE
jgi:putative ABC transport system permease protein